MASSTGTPDLPRFIGGALCLDFANTVDPRHAGDRVELLGTYDDLTQWARQARLISARRALDLRAWAREAPAEADGVHRRALALRESVYSILAPGGPDPGRAAVGVLNGEVRRANAMADLRRGAEGWAFQWRTGRDPDRILWPVARSAADLLLSDRLHRVRECESESGCGWLFLDTSKNGRRRWCEMSVCGNRAKARRRRRQARQGRPVS